MIRNYLKVLFRNMQKHWSFTLINILGLATGIACFVLIALFVRDELTYDKIHSKGDRIYRLTAKLESPDIVIQPPNALSGFVLEKYPEVHDIVRLNYQKKAIEHKGELIYEEGFYYADQSLLDIFDYPLLIGDKDQVLDVPNKLVLSNEMAQKYFPDEDPIGKIMNFSNDSIQYEVSGVLAEIPKNSRFQFDFITSFEGYPDARNGRDQWHTSDAVHYLLFKERDADLDSFKSSLNAELKEREFTYEVLLEDFEGLYLNSTYSFNQSRLKGEKKTIVTFSIIGVLILLLACINYVNLTTAKMTVRASEIGVRKVFGAGKKDIRIQFIGETMIFVLIAVVLSSGLVEYFLPFINDLTDKQISLNYWSDPWILPFLIFLIPFVGVLAGFYPSMVLSVLKPVKVLKANAQVGGKMNLRKALVTFQFAITLMLIISTVIMNRQFQHFMEFKGGIDKEHVVRVGIGRLVNQNYDLLKNEFSKIPGVTDIIGGPFGSTGGIFPVKYDENEEEVYVSAMFVSQNYLDVMGLKVIKGRTFLPDSETDFLNSILINETMAKEMGWDEPVGMKIQTVNDKFEFTERTIIGVMEDFSFNAKRSYEKVALQPSKRFYEMSVKLQGNGLIETMESIREGWETINPGVPFEYKFLEDHVQNYYQRESKFSQLFNAFSTLAILIATLGLIGLSAYTTARRAKEIGVRKVLGASFGDILKILSRGYIGLVVLAFLIAAPVSYFFVENWLNDFANRISISVEHYIIGIVISIIIVWASVAYQSIKAARINPVNLLRNE